MWYIRTMPFNQEIANRICERIADGESLRTICESPNLVSRETVYRWLREGVKEGSAPELQAFCDQYARARDDQSDTHVDDIIQIADDASDDIGFMVMEDKDGEGAQAFIKHNVINRAKLRIEARKWVASKQKPKKYGERIEHTGKNGGPIQTTVAVSAEEAKIISDALEEEF